MTAWLAMTAGFTVTALMMMQCERETCRRRTTF
jgi:hypothetical protein